MRRGGVRRIYQYIHIKNFVPLGENDNSDNDDQNKKKDDQRGK